ncbi:MAG: hypothetical protein O2800_02210 [Planctomycetota bacterium]|nr:hypothetical protein [Planctomycetota bacterium]
MEGARVKSVDALREAKVALADCRDRLGSALSEASSDLERFALWLEREQPILLAARLRKQEEEVTIAKSALYRKQIVVSAKDSTPSVVDEKKMLQRAIARMEATRGRLAAVKRWAVAFQRELLLYKGAVSGMNSSIEHDLPLAIATVNRMAEALARYLADAPPDLGRLFGEATTAAENDVRAQGQAAESMRRAQGSNEVPPSKAPE